MISLAIALLATAPIRIVPTDDVWVYPHASDPAKDMYLRAWGQGGKSVADSPDGNDDFSYSYLKFDLAQVPKGKLKSAKLVVWHISEPGFTETSSGLTPLEGRAIVGDFKETEWEVAMSRKVTPVVGPEGVFGTGAAPAGLGGTKEFQIVIDLMKGPRDFSKAISGSTVSIAITSKVDPSEGGMKSVYKFYSRNAEERLRPYLELELE
jgi:hypothetical protein